MVTGKNLEDLFVEKFLDQVILRYKDIALALSLAFWN
jgi:hypothetical protein